MEIFGFTQQFGWFNRNSSGFLRPGPVAASRRCLSITSHIAQAADDAESSHRGIPDPQPYRSINQPVAGKAMAAPKYWKESITPEAKPAILRPPMSIAAAVPSSECVELTRERNQHEEQAPEENAQSASARQTRSK